MMIVKYDRKLLGRRMTFIRLNANYAEINTVDFNMRGKGP